MITFTGVEVAFILTFLLFLPVMRDLLLIAMYLSIQLVGGYIELLFDAPIVVNLATIFATVFIIGAFLIHIGWITT